jgi:protoporphyrinogen oxidase
MKILIIGAGISGLYSAYKLYEKYGSMHQIQIIEKSNRIGGRINSLDIGDRKIELGAGVLLENHHNMIKLMNEFHIASHLNHHKSSKYYVALQMNKKTNHYEQMKPIDLINDGFLDTIKNLNDLIVTKKISPDTARSYSLYGLLESVYGIEVAKSIFDQFGYDGDISDQNALDGINMLIRELGVGTYSFSNGYIEIINKIYEFLIEHNIDIRLDTECADIQFNNNVYKCIIKGNENTLIADHLILAVPKHALCKINYLSPIRHLLTSVVSKSLMRVYLRFPIPADKKVWFDEIKGTMVTDTMLRQIIPYDKSLGIIMIYTSGSFAINLNYLLKKSKQMLIEEIMHRLKQIFFDRVIDDPINIYTKFWKRATHVWKPTFESNQLSEKILKPFPDKNLYIVGEAYAVNQQWASGAISTVDRLMDQIKI